MDERTARAVRVLGEMDLDDETYALMLSLLGIGVT
jgi:hypothetical protein